MSRHINAALRHVAERYEGREGKIWMDRPSSAELVYRFLEFEGVGPKIATMAASILVRRFKVSVSDHFSIDILLIVMSVAFSTGCVSSPGEHEVRGSFGALEISTRSFRVPRSYNHGTRVACDRGWACAP